MLFPVLALAICLQGVAPEKLAKSKDPLDRLAAIEAMAKDPTSFEKPLIKLLDDDDWEVRERVAYLLASFGRGASKEVQAGLVETALEGPVRRLRHRAALSLKEIDGPSAYERLAKKIKGDEAIQALEAIALLGDSISGKVKVDPVSKQLGEKVAPPVRQAAARALVTADPAQLSRLLADGDLAVRAAAIEAAGAASTGEDKLLALLSDPKLPDVLTRRCYRALQRSQQLDGDEKSQRALESGLRQGAASKVPAEQRRIAALIGVLVDDEDGAREIATEFAMETLQGLVQNDDASVRSACVDALASLGTDAALALIEERLSADESPRVRHVALASLEARIPEADFLRLAALRLADDPKPRVRIAAAVALGKVGSKSSVSSLSRAVSDEDWRVAVTAAVSLGITELENGAPPLIEMYAAEGWRRRGGAIAGLVRLRQKVAMPTILAALDDEEPLVRKTALVFLKSISGQDLVPERKAWETWWAENGDRIRLSIPEEVRKRRAELEYVGDPAKIYEDLDTIVLESRGDHIENLLAFLELDHRLTRSGQLIEHALHPEAVFVSNCTGEILESEVERLAWFVYTGGYLFGSCWAVQETIARAVPGYVRRLRTGGDVLDDVPAYPTDPDSKWLEGVFPTGVRPIYHLEGAYLIEVLEPELVEVLVDSPECASKWGDGNLAAWFPAGHGIVLDSVNHFDLQGLETAVGLKKPEDRMAYAIDHLGLSYAELRELRSEKFWKRLNTTAQRIKDLSVFRLVTNFVRQKRL